MEKFNNQNIAHVVKVGKEFNNVMDYENTLWQVNENLFFNVTRKGNDINGNPLYKLVIVDSDLNIINQEYKGKFYRTYKNYSLIQSYSISDDLCRILGDYMEN